jgi:hypothetical protein
MSIYSRIARLVASGSSWLGAFSGPIGQTSDAGHTNNAGSSMTPASRDNEGSGKYLTKDQELLASGIWEIELPGGEWQPLEQIVQNGGTVEKNPGDQEQSLGSTSRVRLGITFPNPETAEKFFRVAREIFDRAGVPAEKIEQTPLQDKWSNSLEVVDARGQFHRPVAGYLVTDRESMEKVKAHIVGDLRL